MPTLAHTTARPRVPTRAGRAIRGEWHRLTAVPVRELRSRGLRAIALTVCIVLSTFGFWLAWRTTWGSDTARVLGGVSAGIPLPLALLRTPVSLVVPAPDLPVWGALLQVLLLFGLAELELGRRRTLVVAYVATLCGTLWARAMVAIGPDHVLGLDAYRADVLDTGPSAAVVGLVVCIAMVRRAPILFTGVWALMIAEVVVKPNLAGREHLAAMTGVTLLTAASLALDRSRRRRGARPDRAARRQ
ncbi:hypothetical protein [Streptomyces sp. SID3343]|uniref:hypothetical protein n=1 Tax=Streptomyces sp. SID3343 TaxID=2690260 RepID=UPI001369E942|nr:hypothetical protein [Streptomyces sp. SID3343]MYV99749.1 hypothetical protein [Streptomyces sp. SID3343]